MKRMLAASARAVLAIAVCVTGVNAAMAQDNNQDNNEKKTFSVCALNVDGLPNKILGIDINPDGKGAEGAKAIGEYLSKSGVDVMALSEDFNYHENLVAALGEGYNVGTYRGGLDASDINASVRFNTDGLEFVTKQPIAFTAESWTAWAQNNGKFTNGSDELITKGYRFYTVDLGDGVLVDFYTMHMDADTDPADNAARASQWAQLRDAVLANRNGHAIIVMGDTNSRYTRDDILSLFINPIEESNLYSVGDAWINLCQNGVYPELDNSERLVIPDSEKNSSEAYRKYEIVDKVLYLNPQYADNYSYLTPQSILFDAEGYTAADGTLLGDHVPVVVNFEAHSVYVDSPSFIPQAAEDWWNGEKLTGDGQEGYLFNVGKKYYISHDATPSVTDIDNAPTWFVRTTDGGFTFDSDIYRLHMEYQGLSWNAAIRENSGATTFSAIQNDAETFEDEYVYKLSKQRSKLFGGTETRYFNIDSDNGTPKYTAAQTEGPANDWILISPEQKQTYDRYVSLYHKAKSYLAYEWLSDDVRTALQDVLSTCSHSYYLRSSNDNKSLEDIIAVIDDIAAGVDAPSATSNAKEAAVYTTDGKRIATTHRGLNIVRMTDGTVKKVLRK